MRPIMAPWFHFCEQSMLQHFTKSQAIKFMGSLKTGQ